MARGCCSQRKDTDGFAGWCGLWYPEGWSCEEIGWVLTPDAVGHGFATEAALFARRYGYETLGLDRLISYIDPDNAPSIRVAQRLGARHVGTETPLASGAAVGVYEHVRPPA